jgi:orotate phosphoribosyltransferase
MNRNELAQEIYRVAYLTGTFKLRSGQTSHEYFDKYRFEAQPRLLEAIAELMLPLLPKNIDLLAGLEMGGIPIATALSMKSGIPAIFVRKEAKAYGTCKFAEGGEIKGKRLLIVEDVVTTGGQVVISTEDLRKEGAIVENVLCSIYRGEGEEPKLKEIGLRHLSLFTMNEIKKAAGKN